MGQPHIRDFISFVTTLPASFVIFACLILPHTRSCKGVEQTPFDTGAWILIAPVAILSLLPVAWRCIPCIRRGTPELVLMFTMIALALLVITIPIAIYLMWSYAKRSLRGEALVATCGVAFVMVWLVFYPLLTAIALLHWLPAAQHTWNAALVAFVGLVAWASAAVERTSSDVE